MDGEISPAELERRLGDGPDDDPLVVDIRQPRAFAQQRIPGSVNVPFNRLPNEVETVADADHVVTVCPHGEASIRAARLITAFEGFDGRVESLESGLTGWDGPLERETERDGDTPDAPF
ncbi:MAG: rhodanese-like domain-containing protein [Halovenus sp.]